MGSWRPLPIFVAGGGGGGRGLPTSLRGEVSPKHSAQTGLSPTPSLKEDIRWHRNSRRRRQGRRGWGGAHESICSASRPNDGSRSPEASSSSKERAGGGEGGGRIFTCGADDRRKLSRRPGQPRGASPSQQERHSFLPVWTDGFVH